MYRVHHKLVFGRYSIRELHNDIQWNSPAVGSKNCAFYDKRMKLGTVAAHIFLKKFRYRAIAD